MGPGPIFLAVVAAVASCSADRGSVSEPTASNEARETTATPPRSTTTAAPTTTTAAATLEMRGDGLGSVPFGSDAGDAMRILTSRLGTPDGDTGDKPFEEQCATALEECRQVGAPCATAGLSRTVEWPTVLAGMYGTKDSMRFAWWLHHRAPDTASERLLATPEGVTLRDPLDAWRARYGPSLTFERVSADAESDPWTDAIKLEHPSGRLTGFTNDGAPPTLLDSLFAGTDCSAADY